jgi:hypothetical protein
MYRGGVGLTQTHVRAWLLLGLGAQTYSAVLLEEVFGAL